MKKLIILMSAALVLAICRNSDAQEIHVVTEKWEPYNFVEDGQIVGISTEIVEHTLQQAGIVIKNGRIGVYPWEDAYAMALHEENVLIYTILRTEDRENLFKWIGPLIPPEKFYFYKHRTRSDVVVKTLDDAKRYHIGILPNSIHEQFLVDRGFSIKLLEPADTQESNMRRLLADRIDLIIDLDTTLTIRTQKYDLPLKEFEKELFLFEYDYYMAFSRNTSETVVERVRSAFQEVQTSDVIENILKRYE